MWASFANPTRGNDQVVPASYSNRTEVITTRVWTKFSFHVKSSVSSIQTEFNDQPRVVWFNERPKRRAQGILQHTYLLVATSSKQIMVGTVTLSSMTVQFLWSRAMTNLTNQLLVQLFHSTSRSWLPYWDDSNFAHSRSTLFIEPVVLSKEPTVRIQCMSGSMIITIKDPPPSPDGKFSGMVYPKGLSKNSTCLSEYRWAKRSLLISSCQSNSHLLHFLEITRDHCDTSCHWGAATRCRRRM